MGIKTNVLSCFLRFWRTFFTLVNHEYYFRYYLHYLIAIPVPGETSVLLQYTSISSLLILAIYHIFSKIAKFIEELNIKIHGKN
jgi:hypothetical protein